MSSQNASRGAFSRSQCPRLSPRHMLALRNRPQPAPTHGIVDAPLINVAGSVANYEGRFETMLNGANATLANIKAAAEAEDLSAASHASMTADLISPRLMRSGQSARSG